MANVSGSIMDAMARHFMSMNMDHYVRGLRAETAFLGRLDWTNDELKVYNKRLLDIQYRLTALRAKRLASK